MTIAVFTTTTEGEEALAAATAETLCQIRGSASIKARVLAWGVSFDSTSAAAEPILVRLARQTTDGTGSGASEVLNDPDDAAALLTSFNSFSAEPSLGDILEEYDIAPQGLPFVKEYPLGYEPVIDSATTSRIAIVVTAPAVVNAVAWIRWGEGG